MIDVADTADIADSPSPPPQSADAVLPQRSELPPVDPPRKLSVMGVPTGAETKLVSSDATRFRGRGKYRGWA